MWKRWFRFLVPLSIILLGGCTYYWPPPDKGVPEYEKSVSREAPSDADLFHEGMSYLDGSSNRVDYEKARATFDRLLKLHPESRWKNLVEVLVHVIDDVYACREKMSTGGSMVTEKNADMDSLRRENEQLKRNNRILLDRLNTETAKLVQENEQLKKDIERLKNLEVQLEKRDKMLR